MAEKKLNELTDEQLEKVSGGYDTHTYLPAGTYGDVLGCYETEQYENKECYFVVKWCAQEYYWGTLLKSFEDKTTGNNTVRSYKVMVTGRSSWGTDAYLNEHTFTSWAYDVFPKIG